jgi:ABC-2 type transport system ATP-binding protein
MKRRLMIARALINDPEFLILDEPTAGVDVELRHGMWDYLKQKNKEGTTILLTTHYLEEAEQLCNDVAIIKEGAIVKTGTVKKLIGSLDKQTYVLSVHNFTDKKVNGYDVKMIDENTIEIDLGMHQTVNDLVGVLNDHGIIVNDLRPKGNRLEQLFLNILNGKS